MMMTTSYSHRDDCKISYQLGEDVDNMSIRTNFYKTVLMTLKRIYKIKRNFFICKV